MTSIMTQPVIANKAVFSAEALGNKKEIFVSTHPAARQEINLASLPQLTFAEFSDKPVLKSPSSGEIMPEQLMGALSKLDSDEIEKAAILLSACPPKLTNELHHIFENAEQKVIESIGSAKTSEYIGIMSSEIIVEISKLIRKVASEIKISDRQLNAAFNILSGKMVEAAAASTIKEGKKMMESAMINFGVSLGISGLGAAFQAKSLHTQNKSINANLKAGVNNTNSGNKLHGQVTELTGKNNGSTVLRGKDGSTIEMVDQATAGQKTLVAKNMQNAADSTKAHGQNQLNDHNNIVTKESVKRGVAEQGARLSDSAGNMAGSASQAGAKAESASAMIEQETSSAARKVSENAEKTMSESTELLKKMDEALRDICDSKTRTFQSAIRG
ncbi:hypothetical protein AB7W40_05245 [Providencia rettgeri]|uniref:hypothetical protein n=1 Tax=Providencia TaxID=586 RepID=UPI001B3643BB|nr:MULTISPECIES: hypothetical protein [Providencia]MBQ0397644.1 hypothetical protein [Providencia rettgeri]MDH2396474.1 hypothetical protein [Providencia rettgeri]HCT9039241.1 hypothetical protein [Providencia rettgeri]